MDGRSNPSVSEGIVRPSICGGICYFSRMLALRELLYIIPAYCEYIQELFKCAT